MEQPMFTPAQAVGLLLFAIIFTVLLSVAFGFWLASVLKKDKALWQQEKKG